MKYLGDFAEDATIPVPWSTNDSAGAKVTVSASAGNIQILKTGTTAAKSTTNGVTLTIDHAPTSGGTNLGKHKLEIDTSNDTGDAGWWQPGNDYQVALVSAVVDGQQVNAYLASFSIENRFSVDASAVWANPTRTLNPKRSGPSGHG